MSKKIPSNPLVLCVCGRPATSGPVPIRTKFLFGKYRVSSRAEKVLSELEIVYALNLHGQGDWGNVSEGISTINNDSLAKGGPLFSYYCTDAGVEFHILTEADRSATSVFLPDEREQYMPGVTTDRKQLPVPKTR